MTHQRASESDNAAAEDTGSAAVTTTRARTEAKEPILQFVPFSEINGLHPAIQSLQTQLSIALIRKPLRTVVTDPAFRFALRRNPVWVIRVRNKLFCIGNINTYESLFLAVKKDKKIYCIEVFGVTDESIKRNYLCELLYTPALFGVHFSDLDKLADIGRRANDLGLWEPPLLKKSKATASDSDVDRYIAKVYGVDVRKLKSKAAVPVAPTFYEDDALFWEST